MPHSVARLLAAFVAALLMLAAPASAAEWTHYDNARFGYGIDVPPGFVVTQQALDGDGVVLKSPDGRSTLRVYGGFNVEADFEASLSTGMGYAEADGWRLSYKRVTPGWASYSGTRNGQILYARAIAVCGGAAYASFELVYPAGELTAFNPVVDRLVGSLKAGTGAC
jgi:opacity protein-like surface antigen